MHRLEGGGQSESKAFNFESFLRVTYCGGGMVIGNSDWDDGNRIISKNVITIMRSFFGSLAKVG